MAIRFAITSGSWSDPAIWDGGTLPTTGDDVYSNNFSINIDIDITVNFLSSRSTTGVNAGGSFRPIGNRIINANIFGSQLATTNNQYTLWTRDEGNNITVNGIVYASLTNNAYSINIELTDTLTINAPVDIAVDNNQNTAGARNIRVLGILNVNGDLYMRAFNQNSRDVIIGGNDSTININGNVYHLDTSWYFLQTTGQLNATGFKVIVGTTGVWTFGGTLGGVGVQIFNIHYAEFELTGISKRLIGFSSPNSIANLSGTFTRPGNISVNVSFFQGNYYYTGNITGTNFSGGLIGLGNLCNFYVTGNITGGTTQTSYGIAVSSGPDINLFIYGNVTGGNGPQALINWGYNPCGIFWNMATGKIEGNITAIATATGPAIMSINKNTIVNEAVSDPINGVFPILGRFKMNSNVPIMLIYDENDNIMSLTDQSTNDYPSINDVREGVEYGFLS